MLAKKPRHILYALLLITLSVVCVSAISNTKVYELIAEATSKETGKIAPASDIEKVSNSDISVAVSNSNTDFGSATKGVANAPMFMTIIQGADEEVLCTNDGSTFAKFFLCGASDVRTVTLSQSGTTEWQMLDPNSCVPSVVEDCPNGGPTCNWNPVGGGATYNLSAAGEYRVRVNGGPFYYFKATQNTLSPNLIKEDIVCGNPGRVEVDNVPAGYEYSLNSATGPFQDDPFFDVTAPGSYQVFVRLKNTSSSACVFPSNTVQVDELDMQVNVVANDILCSGELGSIDVDVLSGPPGGPFVNAGTSLGFFTYRLIKGGVTVDTFGPDAADAYTFANVSPGIYSIRVQTNKCNQLITLDTSSNPIEIGNGVTPLAVNASAADSFGCGAPSVDVNIDVTGGTAPYRYSVDAGPFSAPFTGSTSFTVPPPGATYNILVEDANGCQRTATVDVEDKPVPTFTYDPEDANCGGVNDGRIVVNTVNGFGYNLEYSNNNGATFQTSNTFSGLAPGSYDVVVRYTQSTFTCTTTPVTVSVGTPSTISGNRTIDSVPTCLNETGGQITISGASGGTGPYEYSIGAGFSGTTTFTGLGVGTYIPQIRDANGCVEPLPAVVFNPLDKPTDLDFAISGINCGTGTASVTVTETGGTGPYTYQIVTSDGSSVITDNGNNPTFTGLGLGTYRFRVIDNPGCSYDESFAITDISSIGVTGQQTQVVVCNGESNGAGQFLVDGFDGTFSYDIPGITAGFVAGPPSGVIPLTGLASGTYNITVRDDVTLCTDIASFFVQQPGVFQFNPLNVTHMSCQNNNWGRVTATTTGGWGGTQYSLFHQSDLVNPLRGPQNGGTFSNLTLPGDYYVTATDVNGCTITSTTFTLTELFPPTLTLDTADAAYDLCYSNADPATIVVSATGGVGPYQYQRAGLPPSASNVFSNLGPGTYTIEVIDANDCRDTVSVTIEPEITATATITRELECGVQPAEITVNIANGYPAAGDYDYYEVSIDGAPYTGTNNITGNSFVYSIPNNGSIITDTTFQFQVYDSEGCPAETNVVTITPPETIVGTAVPTDTTCGQDNGIVTLVPDTNFGIPPYSFFDHLGNPLGAQNVISGFAPGTYTGFRIEDSRGCSSPILSATIAPSTAIDATVVANDAVCTAGSTVGSIDITGISFGTPDYTYTVQDISGTTVDTFGPTSNTTHNFPNLIPGTYTVVVTDAAGCEEREIVFIDQGQIDIVPDPTNTPPADCTTPYTVFRVDIVETPVPNPPYQIGLVGGPLGPPNVDVDTHDFTGQIAFGTTYFVEVVNALGCRYIERIDPIPPPNPVNVTATATTASCTPAGNGTISYTVDGLVNNPANFTVQLQDTDTGAIITTLPSFTNEPLPFSGTFPNLPPANYQVLVNDDDTQCDGSALVSITTDIPALVIDDNQPALCPSVPGVGRGALVTVRGNGGTGPYEFAYVLAGNPAPAPGAYSTQTTYEIAGPYPATYDFYVRDANGCIGIQPVTVTEAPGVPTPTVDVVNQCVAVANYTVNVTSPLTTGSGLPEDTFQYDIGGGFQDSPNFTVANPGSYTIIVRDGNGCTNTVTADVFDFFAISASATSEPTCNAGDGIITVNTSGGSGNFEFQLRRQTIAGPGVPINVGPPQPGNVFNNVLPNAPGEQYNILVTDLSSNTAPLCTDTAIVEVTLVDSPEITATPATPVTCNGADDGIISVELNPVTATDTPFEYYLYVGASGTPLRGPQNTAIFENLPPLPNYQVEVVSNRGCSDRSGDIPITEPTVFQMTTTNTDFTCDPSSNRFSIAEITSNASGGTTPYTYSMTDGTTTINNGTDNTFDVIDNGTDQTWDVTATDQNGCSITRTVTINRPTELTFSYAVRPIQCDPTDGVTPDPGFIDITITGGSGNYLVDILPASGSPISNGGGSTVSWPVDTPGDYIFEVTDVGGCTYVTDVVNVPDYNTIEAVIAEETPTCFGTSDGEINITINNYTGRYRVEVFTVDNVGVETSTGVIVDFDTTAPINTPEIISNLPAGNLVAHVEALDAPFCDTKSNVTTVRQPDRALSISQPDELEQTAEVTCLNQGEITITPDGGWGGYQYQVLDSSSNIIQDFPSTNNIISGLAADTYTINVIDSLGCPATNTITLNPPTPIAIDRQIVSPLQCNNDNDAVIEAFNVSGGQGPGNYLYELNRLSEGTTSGFQSSPIFPNLSAGDYSITVRDGWGCFETSAPITIDDPEIVVADLVELVPVGCGDTGVMRLTIANPEVGVSYFYRRTGSGDPFVEFDIADPTATTVDITENITIDPGPFQYDVQNSNGCPFEQSNQVSLDPAAPLLVDIQNTPTINCYGESTAIIRSEAFGGVGSYTYTLVNNDLGASTNGGVPTRSPLPGDIVPNGGPQSSGIFRDQPSGNYWVYGESGGCIDISDPIVITDPPELVLDYLEEVEVSCNGFDDGQLILEASGGTGTIRYSISDTLSEFFEPDDPSGPNPNRKTFTDLPPRDYDIIIQDDLGCTITRTVTIGEPAMLVAGIADSTPEICLGENNGTVTLNVNGGTPPYEFAVNSSADADFAPNPSMFFDNLNGGETYVIFVRDSRGCETNVIVPVDIGIDMVPIVDVAYVCNGIIPSSMATVGLEDANLLPNVLFALNPTDPTDATTALADVQRTWSDLPAGDHTVYIYHDNGCVASVDFTTDSYDPLIVNATKTGPNEITATAEGGYGGYEFFFQGESYGSENVYISNSDANITVRVVDDGGCEAVMAFPFDFTGMLEIPNFFTPDGDGNNDEWFPRNRDFFPNLEVKIYDRYGRVVAILNQVSAWDGTYEGNELPTGDYWYVVNANDFEKQQYVGHFTLYR